MAREEPELVPPIHPGEFVWLDVLIPLRLDVPAAAEKMALDVHYLQALIEKRASVNSDSAKALGDLAGNGPELWIGLQSLWDRWNSLEPEGFDPPPALPFR